VGAIAISLFVGVAGVEYHLALEARAYLAGQLRNRLEGHGEHDDVAEFRRVLRRACRGAFPELGDDGLKLVGMSRGDQDLVPRVSPELCDGRADHSRANDADPHAVLLDGEPVVASVATS